MHPTIMLRRAPCFIRGLSVARSPVVSNMGKGFSTMLSNLENMDSDEERMKTLSVSPLGDASADKNKFYEISDEQFPKSFPAGVDKDVDMLFARLTKKRLMIRESSLKLIDFLKREGKVEEEGDTVNDIAKVETNSDSKLANSPLLVLSAVGKHQALSGVGKTTALMHSVHWARSTGWIVFHINSYELMNGGYWVVPSQEFQEQFDQPQVAVSILKDLIAAHGDQLANISSTNQQADGGSLLELAQEGVNDEDIATNVVLRLLTQLKEQSEVPVLIAVDNFNLLFEETLFSYDMKKITADQFSLVRAFRGVSMCGTDVLPDFSFPAHGAMVVAESNKYPTSKKLDYFTHAGKQLWKQGVKRIPVTNMSAKEADDFIEFFTESGILTNSDPNESKVIKMQSQRNPKALVSRIALKF